MVAIKSAPFPRVGNQDQGFDLLELDAAATQQLQGQPKKVLTDDTAIPGVEKNVVIVAYRPELLFAGNFHALAFDLQRELKDAGIDYFDINYLSTSCERGGHDSQTEECLFGSLNPPEAVVPKRSDISLALPQEGLEISEWHTASYVRSTSGGTEETLYRNLRGDEVQNILIIAPSVSKTYANEQAGAALWIANSLGIHPLQWPENAALAAVVLRQERLFPELGFLEGKRGLETLDQACAALGQEVSGKNLFRFVRSIQPVMEESGNPPPQFVPRPE